MAHPARFRDDDPLLHRVRDLALSFPGAAEKISHGTPTFYTVKVFCQYGAPELMDASYRLTAPTKRIAELDAR